MHTLIRSGMFAVLALLTLVVFLPAAMAQQKDNITFVGVGSGSQVFNISYYNGTTIETEGAYTGEYELSVNGGPVKNVFCTDLFDNVYIPESWQAIQGQTSSATYGLPTANYPVGPLNVNAVDYIAQNYANFKVSAPDNVAAQLAIWDLVIGGQVVKSGSTYSWGGDTIPSGADAGDTVFSANADQSMLAEVYTIEQAALLAKGPQGSEWLDAIQGTQSTAGRPQDFAFDTPEPGTIAAFLITGLGILCLMTVRAGRESKARRALCAVRE